MGECQFFPLHQSSYCQALCISDDLQRMATFLELDMHKFLAKSMLGLPFLLYSVEELNGCRLVGMREYQMRVVHMEILPET